MPGLPAHLRTADRTALAALCLLLVTSVSERIYAYSLAAPGTEPTTEVTVIDLGGGIRWLRTDGARQKLRIASCPAPVTVDLVEPSPHGRDASLAVPPNPGDQAFYVYRGWILHGPHAAMKLGALYFLRRVGALVGIGGPSVRDELAAKVIVPASCHASPEDVLAVLRREA